MGNTSTKSPRFDLGSLLASVFGLVGGIACVAAGGYLLASKTVNVDSYLQVVAHGIGLYFVGKGLYLLQAASRQSTQFWQLRDLRVTLSDLATTLRSEYSIPQSGPVEKECKHCRKPVPPTASVCFHCGRDIKPWIRFEDAWWYVLEGTWYYVSQGKWIKAEEGKATPGFSSLPPPS